MPSPTTSTEALSQCEKLWSYLAETGSTDKIGAAFALFGYNPHSGCPACEWDKQKLSSEKGLADLEDLEDLEDLRCTNCPIDSWTKGQGQRTSYACESPGSPYAKWRSTDDYRRDELMLYASQVLELIQKSSK